MSFKKTRVWKCFNTQQVISFPPPILFTLNILINFFNFLSDIIMSILKYNLWAHPHYTQSSWEIRTWFRIILFSKCPLNSTNSRSINKQYQQSILNTSTGAHIQAGPISDQADDWPLGAPICSWASLARRPHAGLHSSDLPGPRQQQMFHLHCFPVIPTQLTKADVLPEAWTPH